MLPGHVGQDLVHGPALSTGGREGQAGPEGFRVCGLHGGTGGGGAAVLHAADAQLQHQKLFIDEPPPGRKGFFFGGRAVDGPHGFGLGRQAVFAAHLLRQRVGQKLGMGQQLPHALGNGTAGKTLGLGVHGLERGCLHLFGSAHQRVDHLTPQHPAGDDALKIVFLPDLQFLGGIGVVEPGDLQPGHVIPGGDPLHPPSTGQDAPAGLGKHLCLDHAFRVGRGFRNGVGLRKVDVFTGIMAQKVGQRHDAQLLEPLGGLGAYPLQVAHRRVRREGDAVFGGHGWSAPFLDAI